MTLLLIVLLTVLLLLALLSIYVYLIGRKAWDRRVTARKERWLEERMPELEELLFAGRDVRSLIPTAQYQYEALENIFSDFLANYRFEGEADPLGAFINRYFVPYYRRRLGDRRWSVRMNALYFIDLFGIQSMKDDLLGHLSRKGCSPEERFQIFLLLAKFEHEGLMELLKKAKELPAFLLNELAGRLVNQDNVDSFVDEFGTFADSWKGAILEVVRDRHLRSDKLQLLLEELIVSDSRELRVKALKTLASLGYLSSIERFVEWMEGRLESEPWSRPQASGERLMAARLMGQIRDDRFLPYLKGLVGDNVYGVRSEAAKSIRQYRGGMDILRSLAESHEDPFARSISREWAERSLDYD